MARKRKSSRRRRRGMGSLLTIRQRSGFGSLKDLKRVDPMSIALPVLIGGGITALTVAGIRYSVVTSERASTNQQSMYRNASAWGIAAGAAASGALYFFGGGASAAASAAVSSIFVAATGFVHDWYSANFSGVQRTMLAPMASETVPRQPILEAEPATAAANGLGNFYQPRAIRGARGMGAVVPESLNGIVMEPVGSLGSYAQTAQGGGYEVNLGAINTGAFGTPGFRV